MKFADAWLRFFFSSFKLLLLALIDSFYLQPDKKKCHSVIWFFLFCYLLPPVALQPFLILSRRYKPLSSLYLEQAMNRLAWCHRDPFTTAQWDRTAATISQSAPRSSTPICTVKRQNGHFTDPSSPPHCVLMRHWQSLCGLLCMRVCVRMRVL